MFESRQNQIGSVVISFVYGDNYVGIREGLIVGCGVGKHEQRERKSHSYLEQSQAFDGLWTWCGLLGSNRRRVSILYHLKIIREIIIVTLTSALGN